MIMVSQKVFFSFVILFFCLCTQTHSQTEKQIVDNYRKALKKAADDDYVQSMELRGEFILKKITLPVTIYFKSPNFLRMEMKFQDVQFLQISNDTVKWEYNPFEDRNTITKLDKSDSKQQYKNSDTFDFVNQDLLNYKEWNHVIKFKGKEIKDSLEVYVLELTNKSRKATRMTFYINTKNNLLYKIEDEEGFRYFADYVTSGDYVFPRFMFDSKPDETMEAHFTHSIINKPVPDSLFIIPQSAMANKTAADHALDKMLVKGDSLYELGQFDEAETYYTRFIKQKGKNYYVHNARGLVKIAQKEYYDAIMDFKQALEIDPSGVAATNNLGLAKFYLGDTNGAIKDYTKALEIDPGYVTSLKNRGHTYLQLKDYEKAAVDFKDAIKLKPDDGESHFKYAVALAQLQQFEEALTSYRLAIGHKFQRAEVYNYKGVSEYKLERYDSAIVSFEQAVQLDSESLQYLENYGRAFYELGHYETAVEQFERSLKKNNDQPEIHNLIGLCKYKDENYKGAIKNFSKSIELDGENATYYDNRAAAKEMMEDYEGAIKDYGESIRVYPNDASVFYKRGLIKLYTSKKIEGCLDLATANEMKFDPAREAIIKNCN